ncbi:hypothetical protein B0H11DRAFT_2267790 [Mycena galericulata]|nr:hypothetical protein B0H11DRAFT_2267790 [Mycena galericulata]
MSVNHDKGKQPQRETIDIEEDDARIHRIQHLLEKLNTIPRSGPAGDTESILNAAGASNPGQSGESLSELLARVQAFLPQIEASNAELATLAAVDPRSVDIENVDGDEEVIQMKLGLGVFEDRTGKEASSSDEESESDEEDSEDSTDSGTTTSDESDSSSSEDESSRQTQGTRQVAPLPKRALLSRAIKPLPRRTRPEIVVLSETTTEEN